MDLKCYIIPTLCILYTGRTLCYQQYHAVDIGAIGHIWTVAVEKISVRCQMSHYRKQVISLSFSIFTVRFNDVDAEL